MQVRKGGCSGDAVASKKQEAKPGNFAMIAKISLGLRNYEIENFHNPSEIFAM